MDPLTIATVTGHCFQVAKASWEVGALLYTFIKEARVVNETVSGLANEVNQLGNVLDLVEDILKTLERDLAKQPHLARSPHQSILRSIKLLESQVNGCESTVEALRTATKDLKDKNGHFAAKAATQFRVNMNKETVKEISRRISSHYHALNCCLSVLNTQVIYILPQRADADVKFNVEELREQEQTLDSRKRLRPLTGPESELLQLTRTTIDDGESLYEQSVANGSVIGGDLTSDSSLMSWLSKVDLQSSEQGMESAGLWTENKNSELQSTQRTTPSIKHEDLQGGTSKLSSSIEEPSALMIDDPGDDIACMVASQVMSAANEAFDKARYAIAKAHITETLTMVKSLQSNLHASFDLFKAHYILAMSSWYTDERDRSKPNLIEFLHRQPSNDAQRLDVCTVSTLLARLYVEQGELEHARSSCESGLKARKILLGPESDEYGDSLAFMARIHSLLGNPAQSEAFASMIPPDKKNECTKRYARLAPKHKGFGQATLAELRPRSTFHKKRLGRSEVMYAILSPINEAFRSGDIQRAIELVKAADSKTIDDEIRKDGFSPLHVVAVLGSMEAATVLLDRGAKPHLQSVTSCKIPRLASVTPLQCAIRARRCDMVRLLTRYGGITNDDSMLLGNISKDMTDDVANEGLDMLQCLLDLGYDVNTRTDSEGSTLLHDVYCDVSWELRYRSPPATKSRWMTVAPNFLIKNGANVLLRDHSGRTPLMICLKNQDCRPPHIQALVKLGPKAQLVMTDRVGRTPLHYCLRSGGYQSSGHDVPTSVTAMNQVLANAAVLIRAGASKLVKDGNGHTPLHTWWYNNGHPSSASLSRLEYSSGLDKLLNELVRSPGSQNIGNSTKA